MAEKTLYLRISDALTRGSQRASGAADMRRAARRAASAPTAGAGTQVAPTQSRVSRQWLAALWQRMVSALFLIPIIIFLVFFGGWWAFGGALLALALGSYELHTMLAQKGWRPLTWLSVTLGVDFLLAAVLFTQRHDALQLLGLVGVGVTGLVVVSFGWLLLMRTTHEASLLDWALTVGSAFYLGWPLAFFLLLRGPVFGASPVGFWWLLAVFFMVWANDTFALLVGHTWGRTKLAPHVSPGKTWEGFFGGLVFTMIAALVFTIGLPAVFGHPLHVAWYHALILGALVCVAATVGDLAESLLKRATGVKDSGTIIPGHGGLLDRMDSLLFAVLVVFFYAAFLHAIPL